MKPILERWVQHENCIAGYIFDSNQFRPGTRVITEAIRFIDPVNFEAECLDGRYRLGEPGTFEEHNRELFSGARDKEEGKAEVKPSLFLNPRG